jgi:hydrogenase maturation protease
VTTDVLVAGIGNIFLGDDGFGPEVARALLTGDRGVVELPDGVRVVDYGIRGMHLAYDLLGGVDALVIVDAVPGDGPAGSLSVIEVTAADVGESGFDAHGMDPMAVLGSLTSLGGAMPPTYVVGCCPMDVADGIGLSPPVAAAVDGAVALVARIATDLCNGRPAIGGERECASESPAR